MKLKQQDYFGVYSRSGNPYYTADTYEKAKEYIEDCKDKDDYIVVHTEVYIYEDSNGFVKSEVLTKRVDESLIKMKFDG